MSQKQKEIVVPLSPQKIKLGDELIDWKTQNSGLNCETFSNGSSSDVLERIACRCYGIFEDTGKILGDIADLC